MLQQKEGPRGESNPNPRRYPREMGPLIYKREGTSHQAHFALNTYAQFIHLQNYCMLQQKEGPRGESNPNLLHGASVARPLLHGIWHAPSCSMAPLSPARIWPWQDGRCQKSVSWSDYWHIPRHRFLVGLCLEVRVANCPPNKDCTVAMGYCMASDHDTRVGMSPQPPQDGRWATFVTVSYKNMALGEAQLTAAPAYHSSYLRNCHSFKKKSVTVEGIHGVEKKRGKQSAVVSRPWDAGSGRLSRGSRALWRRPPAPAAWAAGERRGRPNVERFAHGEGSGHT
jgi:hypothetical protein